MLALVPTKKSLIKINAVKDAIRVPSIKVEGRDSKSFVNEQPVGFEEIMLGAENRLSWIISERPDYCFSMESGIVETGPEEWTDMAYVIVVNKAGVRHTAWSAGVIFPYPCVLEAQMAGFETTTVGSIIAKRLGGSEADPHYTLTGVRRQTILTLAIKMAYFPFFPIHR